MVHGKITITPCLTLIQMSCQYKVSVYCQSDVVLSLICEALLNNTVMLEKPPQNTQCVSMLPYYDCDGVWQNLRCKCIFGNVRMYLSLVVNLKEHFHCIRQSNKVLLSQAKIGIKSFFNRSKRKCTCFILCLAMLFSHM